MDTSLPPWTRNKLLRRVLLVALFAGILFGLRQLLVMLVFFVAFERLIGWPAELLCSRLRWKRKWAVLVSFTTLAALVGGAVAFGVARGVKAYFNLRTSLPDRIAAFRETALFRELQEHAEGGADNLIEGAKHYASQALSYATTVGHMLAYALIGLILAIVYLLEKDELLEFAGAIPRSSLFGTLLRWLHHVYDAIAVTLGFQIVVAAVNAVLTWPVLMLIGIPHATGLMFMIFFSGMVPVAGNFVAGAILTILAWQAKGWTGVIVFTILTFVLHKIESYYLNPRLARKHVRLPGFVLIVSLIIFEKVFGFVGLFLSFPFLFVAGRIRGDFLEEDNPAPSPVAVEPPTEPPGQSPPPEPPVSSGNSPSPSPS